MPADLLTSGEVAIDDIAWSAGFIRDGTLDAVVVELAMRDKLEEILDLFSIEFGAHVSLMLLCSAVGDFAFEC